MCGISLCFGEANVELMNAMLDHRGIRSATHRLTDNMYLGHVRLPIQGLSEQDDHPIIYKGLTGAFVGEIFNFRELSASASSDLQVMLMMVKLVGADAFHHFDGFWSAIIYDKFNNLIHVYTDPLAKKPLYMRSDPFAISSEIKALLPLGPNSFDEVYFSAVAKWGYCPTEQTPFMGITKIPAGTHLLINDSGEVVAAEIYMTLGGSHNHENLASKLKDAVSNRTVSDVPISLLMSGGLDSTIIYELLKECTEEITIFHIDNDESKYLEYVDFRSADKLVELKLDTDYELDKVLWHNDGPVDLGSMIPQFQLAGEIKKHGFNVCLSGDGADELFGGYKRSMEYDSQYSDIYHEIIHYHLPRLDKMMMAHTVELRCPFLSWPVINCALNTPYRDRRGKQILKDTFRGTVPGPIIDRVKQPLRHRSEKLGRYQLIDNYKSLIKKEKLA